MRIKILNDNTINIQSSDSELISSFIKGNQSAFNYIVLKYQKNVYFSVRKMVLYHDMLEDYLRSIPTHPLQDHW